MITHTQVNEEHVEVVKAIEEKVIGDVLVVYVIGSILVCEDKAVTAQIKKAPEEKGTQPSSSVTRPKDDEGHFVHNTLKI